MNKNQLIMMDFADFKKLENSTLSMLNSSDAILTSQPDDFDGQQIKDLFNQIFAIYKKDQEKTNKNKLKYENILKTVIYFISTEDYERLNMVPQSSVPEQEEDPKAPIDRLVDDLAAWGGLDRESLLFNIKKDDLNNISTIMNDIEEGLTQLQESDQKYQEEHLRHTKAKDTKQIKKVEEVEATKKAKRQESVEAMKKLIKEQLS